MSNCFRYRQLTVFFWCSSKDHHQRLLVRAFKDDDSVDNNNIGNYGDTLDQPDEGSDDNAVGSSDNEGYFPSNLREIPRQHEGVRNFKRSNIMTESNYLKYTGDRLESDIDNVRFGNTAASYQTNGRYRGKNTMRVEAPQSYCLIIQRCPPPTLTNLS